MIVAFQVFFFSNDVHNTTADAACQCFCTMDLVCANIVFLPSLPSVYCICCGNKTKGRRSEALLKRMAEALYRFLACFDFSRHLFEKRRV